MDSNLEKRAALLVENRNVLKSALHDDGYMNVASAEIFTSVEHAVDMDEIKRCHEILKKKTNLLSSFRSYTKLPLVSEMALSENADAYFENVKNTKKLLDAIKWTDGNQRTLATMMMCRDRLMEEPKYYAERTIEIYNEMKEHSGYTVGTTGLPIATILAINDMDSDWVIKDRKQTYDLMSADWPFMTKMEELSELSNVLALGSMDAKTKVSRASGILQGLKDSGHRISNSKVIAIVGILAITDMAIEDIVKMVSEVDDYLEAQKGFGKLGLGTVMRRMLSVQVVFDEYGKEQLQAQNPELVAGLMHDVCSSICLSACQQTSTTDYVE